MSVRNNIQKLIYLFAFLLLSNTGFSQPFQRELDIIPVFDGTGLLENIFSGGHNNIEHQFVDIDGDGDSDLFYLDSDQTFGWFENIGNKFAPEFKLALSNPPGLFFTQWFFFVDIDNDGKSDYFTANADKISFFRNIGTINSPSFFLESDIVLDDLGQPIFSEFGSNPVFADIDNDGDYDFFSGNSAGTVTYYENVGTPQNFNFRFITNIWQNLIIIGTFTDDPRHGASSLEFIDIDADSDLDLFWGDFFSRSLYVIENQGTPSMPNMIRISDIYPINSDSVYTSGFNMPRFANIDGDGDYDLFVSVLFDPTVPQSLMYYENAGSAQQANHTLKTIDYLKTLDAGNNSAPVFVDIDNDGDLDLFIGSLNNPSGTVHYLENIGTASAPSFYYSDSSYFNISSDLSVSPAFGDIDNDGDYDLFIGKLDGRIEVYLNTGTPSNPVFSNGILLLNNLGQVIDIGSSATPYLLDVDGDGDLDLSVGGFNGRFHFFENTGSASNYEFTSKTGYFGVLDIGDNSTTFLFDYNKDGVLDLFSGSRKGELFYFRNDGNNTSPIWTEITNVFITEKFGGNTFPYFVDIDDDTDFDLFLGNVKGGLYFYSNSEIASIADWEITLIENYSLKAFPNPFNLSTQIIIEVKDTQNAEVKIFNLLGEKVKTLYNDSLPSGINILNWYGDNDSRNTLPSGVYIIVISSSMISKSIKVALLK